MRVFTIPADAGFLPSLVKAILAGGFPTDATAPPSPADLPLWTILVPTRRAARALAQAFLDTGDSGARLLPRIRPIGDVDEDLIEPIASAASPDDAALPPAISRIGREFLIVKLIETWAVENPQQALAAEIRHSPARALGLARGLAELVDSFETEEASLDALSDLFLGDLAEHRLAILDFLAIVRRHLPAELARHKLIGPVERRGRLIRLEAERLASARLKGPIIAAGSTGSIPATAELLKAIALHDQGAVILPGLDCDIDDASWNAISPQHPQYGLKKLLDAWHLDRADVATLPGLERRPSGPARSWLTSEIMRPSETARAWQASVEANRPRIAAAMADVHLIEARHRREEALAIALILRQALDDPVRTAALVTPDRELARRVKAELRRWDVEVDDFAGEPLVRSPQGSLVALLIECAISGLPAVSLASLIHHPLLRLRFDEGSVTKAANIFDLAVLRYGRRSPPLGEFRKALDDIHALATADRHRPDVLRRVSPDDWNSTSKFAARMDEALAPLVECSSHSTTAAIAAHFQALLSCAVALAATPAADDEFWAGDESGALPELVEAIGESSPFLPETPFGRIAPLLLDYLNHAPVRARAELHPRLSIMGLLEARLIRPGIVVMGGLNETKWPASPDSGPWLNRPMRATLGLAMPERHIGLTAHDFAQGFGAETVYLTWSKRVGDTPAVPSRWVLRLKMLLKAAGIEQGAGSAEWLGWARGFEMAPAIKQADMPRPTPPGASRPASLSFTDIETLIRDPYEIYARKVLRLVPLSGVAEAADAGLRGQLIHEALNRFTRAYPDLLPPNAKEELIRLGREIFAPHMVEADVAGFWWPRFLRIAPWFIDQERSLRQELSRAVSEVEADHRFDVAGAPFKLTGRADRIDLLDDGSARIIDFKTGDPPSGKQVKDGLSPQLTLEAAVLAAGGFCDVGPAEASELAYMKLSGGQQPGEYKPLDLPVMDTARDHLAGLTRLLTGYASETAAYIPRRMPKKENEVSRYDHLSRRGEWERKEDTE